MSEQVAGGRFFLFASGGNGGGYRRGGVGVQAQRGCLQEGEGGANFFLFWGLKLPPRQSETFLGCGWGSSWKSARFRKVCGMRLTLST